MTLCRCVISSLLTAGVSAVVGGFCAVQPAFAAAPCGIARATAIKTSSGALLVRRGHERRHYWACLRGGRPVHVGFAGYQSYADDEYAVGSFSFGGHFFAISSDICLEGCGDTTVDVYDLRSRRRVRSFAVGSAAGVLVGTRGGVAVVQTSDQGDFRGIRVWDSRGVTVATRFPPAVRLASVRVARNVLRWRQGGVEHSFVMRSWRNQAPSSLRKSERATKANEGGPSITTYGGLFLAIVAIGGLTVGYCRLASRG